MSSLRDTVARALCPYKKWPCPGSACTECASKADAALAAIREQYAIVPREPTTNMKEIGSVAGDTSYFGGIEAGSCYEAMIAAGEVKE